MAEESDLSDQDFEETDPDSSFNSMEEDEESSDNVSPIGLAYLFCKKRYYNYIIRDHDTEFVHEREPDESTCGLG